MLGGSNDMASSSSAKNLFLCFLFFESLATSSFGTAKHSRQVYLADMYKCWLVMPCSVLVGPQSLKVAGDAHPGQRICKPGYRCSGAHTNTEGRRIRFKASLAFIIFAISSSKRELREWCSLMRCCALRSSLFWLSTTSCREKLDCSRSRTFLKTDYEVREYVGCAPLLRQTKESRGGRDVSCQSSKVGATATAWWIGWILIGRGRIINRTHITK